MTYMQTLGPLLPELILAIGAMVLLVLGVFRPQTDEEGRAIGWLAIVLWAGGAVIVLQPADGRSEGAFVSTASPATAADTGGLAAALLLAFDDFTDYRQMRFEYSVLILLVTVCWLWSRRRSHHPYPARDAELGSLRAGLLSRDN